jgi:uncharacterized membrane protein (UPF0136 family)
VKHRTWLVVVLYGLFLVATGILGYVLTGETSSSSLVNGVVFGSLMTLLGVLLRNGRPWTLPASTSAAAIFSLTFLWRGGVQWQSTMSGEDEHLSIALLLTVMFTVSVAVTLLLVKNLRH